MHQTARVSIIESVAQLRNDAANLLERERLTFQQIDQGAAFDERHDDVGVAFGFAKIKDGEDVWMLQFGEDLRFLFEARNKLRIAGEVAWQNFQRHVTIHAGLIRFVDRRHAALALRRNNAIDAELFPA